MHLHVTLYHISLAAAKGALGSFILHFNVAPLANGSAAYTPSCQVYWEVASNIVATLVIMARSSKSKRGW